MPNICRRYVLVRFLWIHHFHSLTLPPSVFIIGVLLYTLLADPRLQRTTKILLVLSKMDLAYRQMRNEALLILQYEKLKKQIRQPIEIVETSSITCDGHEKILNWLSMP